MLVSLVEFWNRLLHFLHKSVSYSFPKFPNDCALSEPFTLNSNPKIKYMCHVVTVPGAIEYCNDFLDTAVWNFLQIIASLSPPWTRERCMNLFAAGIGGCVQHGHSKCGLTLQGCPDQIRHLRDVSIKDIFSI